MSVTKKLLYNIGVWVLLLTACVAVQAYQVEIAGDRITVQADNVPLQELLAQFPAYGIRVRMDKTINPEVSVSLSNVEIQKGVDRILGPLNRAYIWKSVDGPLGTIPRLAEIQVFHVGRRDVIKPLEERNAFAIGYNPKDGTYFVEHEVLLGLRPGVSLALFKSLLKSIKGTIVESHPATGVYKIRVPENADVAGIVEKLGRTDGVAGAEPNYAYPISEPVAAGGAGQLPSSDSGKNPPPPPYNAPVAVLDSGLSPDAGLEALTLASLDAVDAGVPLADSLGHGTQMALIASGTIDPLGADSTETEFTNPIIPVRAFDDNGFTSNFSLMKSIDFAVENGAKVMSLSWGTENRSKFLENAMNYARSKDLIIVASAGNEPTGRPYYPAAFDSVIGVGALGPDGKPWEKSNYGPFVTLSAPGFANLPVGYKGDPGAYAGTSIAAAYTANRIAGALAENPEASIEEILSDLQSTGK
jgi:thermitase